MLTTLQMTTKSVIPTHGGNVTAALWDKIANSVYQSGAIRRVKSRILWPLVWRIRWPLRERIYDALEEVA